MFFPQAVAQHLHYITLDQQAITMSLQTTALTLSTINFDESQITLGQQTIKMALYWHNCSGLIGNYVKVGDYDIALLLHRPSVIVCSYCQLLQVQ